jgi:hypothetical protein
MVDSHFQNAGAPVDYSSPTTYSNTMTAGYSILGQSVDRVNAPGAALVGELGGNSADVSVDTCNLFGGGRRRSRKSKRSRKLKRSNKSRLSTRSKKSRSKSRSKVKKLSKKSLRKSKRNKRKSLR